MTTDVLQRPFNRTQFASDKDFFNFANDLLVETDYTVQEDDCLLTLVTCSEDGQNLRDVLVAVEN